MREAGRIYEMNRFLSDEEEHAVFRAADIAWLGYRGHYGQSAVLVQATMMGLPIIACDEGLIGWQVRVHGLGPTVNISDTRAVSEALSRLAHDRRFSASCGENGKGFSTSHGLDNFSRIIGEEIPTCSSGDSLEKTVSMLEGG